MSVTRPEPVDVLIVEDNPHDLALAQRALRKANLAHHIAVVRDGAEALAALLGDGDEPGGEVQPRPKLVLLDLKLPKVGGLEVLRRLKADPRTRSIPVVALTSSQEQRDVAESYALGVNSYVVKAVDFESFAGAVEQVGRYWLELNLPPEREA